jgi:hypothetical protein
VKQQGERNTMVLSHIGDRDPGLVTFVNDSQILLDGIPSTTLNALINLNTAAVEGIVL